MSDARQWRRIATAPQDGTAVLVFHPAWDVVQVAMRYDNTTAWQAPCGDFLRTPLLWMPLPPPPDWDDGIPT